MSTQKIQETSALTTGDAFELEEVGTATGRWAARLWYVTRHGRTKAYICSAVLRERARGHIILDYGSRSRGGRPSLRTSDRQDAINRAEKRLSKLGEALVSKGHVERSLQLAGGDLTIPQLAAVYFDMKHPTKGNIGQHHADNMVRTFDVALELSGPDWTVSQADQRWIDRMIEEQMRGITFTRVDRAPLDPRGYNTSRDCVGYFMGAVSLACRTPDPHRPGKRYQDVDPFARPDVILPKGRSPRRKRRVGIDQHLRLMSPVRIGGESLPAPVDRADETGATRLMQAAFFHLGVRRAQLRVAERSHIALTDQEVRVLLARYAHSLSPDDYRHFPHGVWLFPGETNKMGHLDEEHYTRVVPISEDLRPEIDLYLERNPELARASNAGHLFPSPLDPTKPISDSAAFGGHEWEWELDEAGRPVLDQDRRPIPQQDENGRWRMKKAGGRFGRAEEYTRDDMEAEGEEWEELFPYGRGSMVHSWRGHLEVLIETLGYIRSVVAEDNEQISLTRHADYLLGRRLEKSVRYEHYIPLDPTILMGMVELREADEVLADRGVRRAAEVARGMEQIRNAREALRAAREAA